MTTKADLRRIIDNLPAEEFDAARRLLESLRSDSVLRAFLFSPEDDEPESDEEYAAVEEAKEALARRELVSDEDLARELDL